MEVSNSAFKTIYPPEFPALAQLKSFIASDDLVKKQGKERGGFFFFLTTKKKTPKINNKKKHNRWGIMRLEKQIAGKSEIK